MADKKITALTAETDIDSDDLAHIVTDVSTSATNKKITVANVFHKIPTFIGYGADSVETVAADGALSDDQRGAIGDRINSLLEEFDEINTQT